MYEPAAGGDHLSPKVVFKRNMTSFLFISSSNVLRGHIINTRKHITMGSHHGSMKRTGYSVGRAPFILMKVVQWGMKTKWPYSPELKYPGDIPHQLGPKSMALTSSLSIASSPVPALSN